MFAYLNGNLDSTAANFIDVSQTTVQANLAIESTKFTSTGVSGSYIAGASRSFDGILIDFEPSGGTSIAATAQFNNLETTMDQIAAAIGSSKMTAFSTPPFNATSSSVWDWSSPFYYGMARHVNLLVAITYNSGSTTGSAYETWMEGQTRSILESVYGDYCVDPRFPA